MDWARRHFRVSPGWKGPAQRLSLFAALLLTLTAAPAAEDPKSRLADLRSRINQLEAGLQQTESERDQLLDELAASERSIGELVNNLRIIATRVARHREELETLRYQEGLQLEQLAHEREELAAQLRAAYAMGHQERLKLLLNQGRAESLSRMLHYYDRLNQARADRMTILQKRITTLHEVRNRISRQEQELVGLQEQRDRERAALEAAQIQRRHSVEALTAALQSGSQELSRLQRDQRRLETLLEGLRGVLADIEAEMPAGRGFGQRRGSLPWPAAGVLEANFGDVRSGERRWDGVMIGAREGDEVRAVHRGRVAFADWLRGFGLLIIVDHGDGYMTLYGHNQSLFKEVGDWVEAAEPLALVGRSGGRSEAGVYFAIRYQGVAENPKKWCRSARGRRVG